MRFNTLRWTALLAGLALTAAACSSGDSEAEQGPAPTETSVASTSTTPATTTEATEPPVASTFAPDDPRGQLDENVAIATEPWPTDWTNNTIDLSDLLLGIGRIDPRDTIAPIDAPVFESPELAADWLEPQEPGALVQIEGDARFYPLSIMTRHEIVNDQFGDIPVAVTYCPLCNTAIAYDRRVDGETLRFGVSGLLRNSDLVMWDDATTSLWQQITGEGIVGEFAGTELEPISTAIVSFGDFAANFPDGTSLSRSTGFSIQYGANPYAGYSSLDAPFILPALGIDDRFPALERVVGVSIDEGDKAYPFSIISEQRAVNDTVGGVPIAVLWGAPETADALDEIRIAESQGIGTGIAFDPVIDDQVLTFSAEGDGFVDEQTGSTWTLLGQAIDGPLAGAQLETVTHRNEFWFAWGAFFPDAAVYEG